MSIIWLIGCREGSNLLGRFLEESGAVVSPVERLKSNDWNSSWVEDWHLLRMTQKILGIEDKFFIQKHIKPEKIDQEVIENIISHCIKMHESALPNPYLIKMGTLPVLWEHIIPKISVEHILVTTYRNRSDRVKSLLRLHRNTNEKDANEFFDRYDENRTSLIKEFRKLNFVVIENDFDETRKNPYLMENVAFKLGLTPTDTAKSLFDKNKILTV